MDFRNPKDSAKHYPIFTLTSAIDEVLSMTRPLPAMLVPLHDALHSVLAEPVKSPLPLPTFRTAKRDGFAVRVGPGAVDGLDRDVLLTRVEVGTDTSQQSITIEANEAIWIPQGGMVPVGANAIVEEGAYKAIQTLANTSDEPDTITLRGLPAEGQNIAAIGEDLEEGMPVLEKGHVLDHYSIGFLASMGVFLVRVHFQPAVGIISVGDHVVDTGSSLQRGKIRDCSRSSLQALFSHLKVAVTDYGIVPCNPSLVEDKIKEAARKCDIVVVIDYDIEGGGRQDTVKCALEELGNVKIGKDTAMNLLGDGWVGERAGGRGMSVASDSGSLSARSSISSYGSRGPSAAAVAAPPPPNPKTLPIRVPSVVPEVEAAAVETVKAAPPPIPKAGGGVKSKTEAANGSAAQDAFEKMAKWRQANLRKQKGYF
ncbi:hypothetical protein TrRE_jg6301 [Triparma retinervis]|uniref:molybdopterin adenylyltransferase n=1 Tax=Triparma retinervis TaxID=2557542 RepID=A0A9W7DPP0_9STRA|nr:hypothetical protein TrRE_jg6301 [Triparma retinervis]